MDYAKTYAPGDIKMDSPEYDELVTIMSRVDTEVVGAFEELGPPPSQEIQRLHEVMQDYVDVTLVIQEHLPGMVTGYYRARNAMEDAMDDYETQSDLIYNNVMQLVEKGIVD